MTRPDSRQTLPRSVRIRSRTAFGRVFARRIRVSDRWLTILAAPNDLGLARLGLAVGKRCGPAVKRNRIKRRVREAFRRVRHELPPGDYVVMPRPGSEPTAEGLDRSLRDLTHRMHPRLR